MLTEIKKIIENIDQDEILHKKGRIKFRDSLFEKIYWNYHPMSENYFFEANPALYYEFIDMFDMGRYPIVMLRDGFLGILDFFLMHPKPPKDMISTLLIHKKYEKLIPKFWKNKIAVYSIESRFFDRELPKKLFVYGLGVEETFWANECENIFKRISDKLDNFSEIHCMFPTRSSELSLPKNQFKNFHIDLLKYAFKYLGDDIKIHENYENFLDEIKESKKFAFYNIDVSKVFLADNYLDHYFYSLGGVNILDHEPREKSKDALIYNLSNNHQVVIEEAQIEHENFSKLYMLFKLSIAKGSSIYEIFKNPSSKEIFEKLFSENI